MQCVPASCRVVRVLVFCGIGIELGVEPWKGILVRMSDKWARIVQLSTKEAAVKDETIEDTLLDLANYALLCILVRRLPPAPEEDISPFGQYDCPGYTVYIAPEDEGD